MMTLRLRSGQAKVTELCARVFCHVVKFFSIFARVRKMSWDVSECPAVEHSESREFSGGETPSGIFGAGWEDSKGNSCDRCDTFLIFIASGLLLSAVTNNDLEVYGDAQFSGN
jgi:hypothetical protein